MLKFDEFKMNETKSELVLLGEEIMTFLNKYAKLAANYDPKYDEESEKFNSPDGSLMFTAAQLLLNDKLPHEVPWSSYLSGGYKDGGQKIHDELLNKIKNIITKKCKCGYKLKGNEKFCSNCGTKI